MWERCEYATITLKTARMMQGKERNKGDGYVVEVDRIGNAGPGIVMDFFGEGLQKSRSPMIAGTRSCGKKCLMVCLLGVLLFHYTQT